MVQKTLIILALSLLATLVYSCQPDYYNKCHSHEECCSNNCNTHNGEWADGLCEPGDVDPPGDLDISFDQFSRAVTENFYPAPSQAQYNSFMAGLPNGQITTTREAAMALSQFLHESDGLQAKREYRCQNDGCPNDYQTPGCDQPNQDYYGRGYIQLTWCDNYKAAQSDLGLGNKLVEDPDSVAREEQLAWNTAYSYWKRIVHTAPGVQQGQFGAATKAINGQLECGTGSSTPAIRFTRYEKVFRIFGVQGSPDPSGC